MKLGIAIEETWDFFHEIYADLQQRHQTALFQRRTVKFPVAHMRINNYLFRRDLKAFLRSNQVVFFEWASQLLESASHLPKQCGIVTRLHRYEMYQWAERIEWERVDRVILVSQAKQREFNQRFPKQAHKSVVSSPSTALDKIDFCPKPFAGNLGILCHLTPRKRVYDLILVFYDLLQHNPDLHLHIAGGAVQGSYDYQRALYQIVQRLNLSEHVTFYGNVTEKNLWYGKIDLFISNSDNEGLQVAPMEAMAAGCYTLSHCWEGSDELVPAENLFTGPSEMMQKVLAYCALPEAEKQQKRQEMRDWACTHFDVRKTVVDVRKVIESVHYKG